MTALPTSTDVQTPTIATGACYPSPPKARLMQPESTKKKQATCDRESSFEPESEDEDPAPEIPSSPEVPLKLLHALELQMTPAKVAASKRDTSMPPIYGRKASIPTVETPSTPLPLPSSRTTPLPTTPPTPKDLSKPQIQHQPSFDPRNPFTQMHMRKPRPKTKPATKAAPLPPPKKAAPSRPAHESPWAKTTPHKKRGQRPAPPPVGSRICYWDGCGMPVPDGRYIWDHIKEEHNSGRPVRVGVKVKTYKGNGGGKGMAKVEIPLKREIDEDYDAPELEEGEILDMDRQDDALEDAELDPAILDALEEHMAKLTKVEETDEQVPVEVELVRSSKTKTAQWFDRVVCRWGGCDRELQFIGLQRHVETKHIPLRGAWCPKGCGRHVARSDMLWRHVENCRM
ncbi:hypothetical protein VTO73DRAFT_10121 [Trametes versicolor]